MKKEELQWHHKNTKDYKRTIRTIICQQNGQLRRNGQISRNVQSPKTESGRNRKYEQTIHQ